VLPLHDDNPTRHFALVTLLLIAVNVFVYAVAQPHDGSADEARFSYEHAAIPCELRQNHPLAAQEVSTGQCVDDAKPPIFRTKHVWLAVVVSMFLHGSWFHVLGNMWFLWIFGNNVEDYTTKLGYVLVYFLCGLIAAATYVLYDPGSTTPIVGASGAIAGIMGMYLVLWPRARVLTLFLFFVFSVPAAILLLAWFGLQFLTDPHSGVAWTAHVGGFVGGAALGLVLRAFVPPRPAPVH
jgi:membrane associated rhomboid family serine protease